MRKLFRFLLWTAIIVGVVVGLARAFALRWWKVPDGDPYLEASIAPTLSGGDWVLLWRLTKPSFGDLVLCPEPDAPGRIVVGRIVGEAGDRVEVEGSRLAVNEKNAEVETYCEQKSFEVKHPTNGKTLTQPCQIEAVGGVAHKRGGVSDGATKPAPINRVVDPGKVFLLSDNRQLPYDSRDFGLVDPATCTESVFFRLTGKGGFSDAEHRFVVIR